LCSSLFLLNAYNCCVFNRLDYSSKSLYTVHG
jgi:hypothetical protein